MKIIHVTPGILPIPPNGWGAVEKIIWEYHQNLLKLGHDSKILYLDDVNNKTEDIVHIHVANLALVAHERGIPYYFTCHDHHAYLYGKESHCFKENYNAIKHSIKSFVPAKYLVDYFNLPNLDYLSHGVNTNLFKPIKKSFDSHKLLCVANNGFFHNQSEDRKGFGFAIEAAKKLKLPITIAGPSNNKSFFKTHNYEYGNLNILYDLNEEELIRLYQDHTIFLHPSILEAGHPNLTLLEAMGCGLPVVGTFEEKNNLQGLVKITRNVDEIVDAVKLVINNYDLYKSYCEETVRELSWEYITKELLSHYNSDFVNQKNYEGDVKTFNIIDVTTNKWNVPIQKTDEEFWNDIYSDNKFGWWGKKSKSGDGSEGDYAEYKTSVLNDIIVRYNISNILDFGCGDFNWMSRVNGYKNYTGVDIVKELIDSHNKKFKNKHNKFIYGNTTNVKFHLDFIKENGKDFDLVILFDILGHQLWDEIDNTLDFIINKLNVNYILVTNQRNCLNKNYWKEKISRNESIDIEIHPRMKRNGFQIVHEFNNGLVLYKLLKSNNMKEKLLEIYQNTKISHKEPKQIKNKFLIDLNNKCKLEILGNINKNYNVRFINKKTKELIYETNIENNMWSQATPAYFIDWNIQVRENDTRSLVYDFHLDLENKYVRIVNESPSLGDLISWIAYIDLFQKKHNCEVDFYTPNKDLFEREYKNINFYSYNEKLDKNYYASYKLGCFDPKISSLSPNDYRNQNLQQIAAEILGFDFKEVKSKVFIKDQSRKLDKKYVCISTSSTAGCKHWQNKEGWQKTVDYLTELGYKVVVIQKEPLNYMDLSGLNNVMHPETKTIHDAISWINHCEFFIGLSSGNSWLAWALNKDVIMISGFTKPLNEFNSELRVINENVCNGCWNNTNYKFDPGDWNWCPVNKNKKSQFECTKTITFEMVKEKIDLLTNKTDSKSIFLKKFNLDSNIYDEIYKFNQYENFVQVKENDFVLDLGCSKGYFYLKHKDKNIEYIGVDGSIDCLNDFVKNIEYNGNFNIIHALIGEKKSIKLFTSMFHSQNFQKTLTITFPDLLKLINRKIDFLKFDIEGYEKLLLDDNYELFKASVDRFSGEFHFLSNYFSRNIGYKILEKMKNDVQIELKLFSLDAVDITERFWCDPNYYNEIIISGFIKNS